MDETHEPLLSGEPAEDARPLRIRFGVVFRSPEAGLVETLPEPGIFPGPGSSD